MGTAYQVIYGPTELRTFSTAAPNRFAPNIWSLRKGLSAESAVFSLTMTPQLSTTTNHGTKVTALDVIYSVSGADLTAAPTDSLAIVHYANGAKPTLTQQTLAGGSYSTAVNNVPGQTYVVHRTISSPIFINSGASTLNLELTFPCDNNTILDILGINVEFSWQP
jgi:hypothetical protein